MQARGGRKQKKGKRLKRALGRSELQILTNALEAQSSAHELLALRNDLVRVLVQQRRKDCHGDDSEIKSKGPVL